MITDYASLQTAIADFAERDDLTSKITTFIQLAEDRLNVDCDCLDMQVSTTIAITGGSTTGTIPSDSLGIVSLYVIGSPNRTLTPLTHHELITKYPSSTTAKPANYAVIGSTLYIGPTPDQDYSLNLIYRQQIPSLASNNTNWLLTRAPSAYLWASLIELALFIQDADKLAVVQGRYQAIIDKLNSSDWGFVGTPRIRAT